MEDKTPCLKRISQAAFERFLAVQPNSYIGYNQLAWHFARRGIELDRAAVLAERANDLQPGNASILDTLGWIAFLREDGEVAVQRLREASLAAGGARPGIDFHLAQAELRYGDKDRGLQLLRVLVEAGPSVHPFWSEAQEILTDATK